MLNLPLPTITTSGARSSELENVSELLLRNESRLPARVLLVNPPVDGLATTLATERDVAVWTQDYRCHQAHGDRSAFGAAFQETIASDACVVLFVPKAKERLEWLLAVLGAQAQTGTRFWLLGGKQQGIASAAKRLAERIGPANKLDAARHAMLFEAPLAEPRQAASLDQFQQSFHDGPALITLPGVFSKGRIDDGTRLLLDNLGDVPDTVLDFGCGCGVIAVHAVLANRNARITAVDSDALAVEATRLSLAANAVGDAEVLAGDGLGGIAGKFGLILSNPPFHDGHRTDHVVTARFIRDAKARLQPNGRLRLVANAFLPYPAVMREVFGDCATVIEDLRYRVLEATNN